MSAAPDDLKGLPAPTGSRPAAATSQPATAPVPASREAVQERVEDNDGDAEDNDGDMGPGERVLLVALPDAGLCRAAVDLAREHGFTVLVTVLASLAPGPAWARGDLSLRLTAAVAA